MKTSYQVGTFCEIPIQLDLSLLALLILIWGGCFDARTGIWTAIFTGSAWAFALLLSIVLHEIGHSLVSMHFGCRVRSITLMILGGRAELSHLPTHPTQELLIAVAGPLASMALWMLGRHGEIYFNSQPHTPFIQQAATASAMLAYLNVRLFWLNLIPAFPMDGGRILRAVLAHPLGRLQATSITVTLGRGITICTLIWLLLSPAQVHLEVHHWQLAGEQWSVGPLHLVFNRWILGLLAGFLLLASEQEHRTVLAEDAYHRQGQRAPWMPPLTPEERIRVNPPPYHRGAVDYRADYEKPRWWEWWL